MKYVRPKLNSFTENIENLTNIFETSVKNIEESHLFKEEHVDPESVGNGTRFLVSEMSGRSTIELKAKEIGIDLDTGIIGEVVETLKELEYEGYHFEVADASL